VELASKSPWLTGKASGHESKRRPKVCGSRHRGWDVGRVQREQ